LYAVDGKNLQPIVDKVNINNFLVDILPSLIDRIVEKKTEQNFTFDYKKYLIRRIA
jgi:hypothetical protein